MKEVTVTVLLEEHELVVGTTGALLLGVTIEVTVMVLLEEQGVVASETRALLPTTAELDLEPEEPELVPDPELGATGWLLGLPEGDERIGLFVSKGVPVDIETVVGAEVGKVEAEEGAEVGTVAGTVEAAAVEVAAVVGATDDTAAAPC